ncbi:carbohydrate ABC transporter permease [Geomicrobium sp. JCM 19039]|uniref:carbohydrate ABC transporter permease n=1 Tax=Geomicrobium sp. JCM 19039 TaxID=1460636 RepID=UPI00045F2AFA|nr:sugar ABC transporter permease [Geomicrobium sp. JCM 19039]GAK12844.1 glycerol-3-phosphate ABC transporter, permease protein UgpA [Geomicrobium sp. JCM 19039]
MRRNEWKNFGEAMLYMLPALIILGIFLFYPMIMTVIYSLSETSPRGEVLSFVGLENYWQWMQSSQFIQSMKSTFIFTLLTVPTTVVLALYLAVLGNEKLKGIAFFRVLFSSTMGVSVAAGAAIWLFLFHPSLGVFNEFLRFFGAEGIPWLTSSTYAIYSVAITTVWMNVGICFIILLGGLQNISDELYDSSKIDGAGYFQRLFKITIPMLSPTLFFVSTITLINSFQSFGQIHILTGGGPNQSTNVIVYSIYREAFEFARFGTASSQAVILFFIILLATFLQFKFGERRVHYQ